MQLIRNPGRRAGVLYLLLLVAPLRLFYIPNTLFVHGDAAATAANITAHATLFRFGMASEVFCSVVLIFLVLAFYRLFAGVDRRLAVLVAILGGVLPAGINFVNTVNDGAALILAGGADFLAPFDEAQRDALAMLFLRLHSQAIVAAETLWGLWLLPLGVLVWRSRFLPRLIGAWLIANGIAYVAISALGLLLPRLAPAAFDAAFPLLLGELVFMAWLLIRGVPEAAPPNTNPAWT